MIGGGTGPNMGEVMWGPVRGTFVFLDGDNGIGKDHMGFTVEIWS